jgi:putative transposase
MWRPKKLIPSQLEERRLEAGRLLPAGQLTQAEIARRMGVSSWTVSQWANKLRESPTGLRALRSRPKTGRPPRLSPQQWQEVLTTLAQGAAKAGFETDRWTLPRVRALILERWGVASHVDYLGVRLRLFFYSCASVFDVSPLLMDQDSPRSDKHSATPHDFFCLNLRISAL